ncbi:hypothetical protein PPSC2_08755 [Paenibacillus polymyxa SC2]|uniref:Uncharacterized protein n=1 Tax=Paenibacillus polymyxa (strain SC2) TaxID=886882 RepID=A0A0D5ZC48_PAEPS|nr:hypothetical protein PPSC2_08755 [Paenibacillus polymyxa SC2]
MACYSPYRTACFLDCRKWDVFSIHFRKCIHKTIKKYIKKLVELYVQVCDESGNRNESKKSDLNILGTLNQDVWEDRLAAVAAGAGAGGYDNIVEAARHMARVRDESFKHIPRERCRL